MSNQLLPINPSFTLANGFSVRTIERQTFMRYALVMTMLIAALLGTPKWSAAQTALDDYVAKEDSSYIFSLDDTILGPGFTGYNIDLTSQTWRDSSEITNRTLWEHKMMIAQPDTILSNTAILVIGGGSNPDDFSASDLLRIGAAAQLTNSVVVDLPTIPNQALQFAGESFTRKEDAIIAKTFANFLDGGDSEWPLLLPMVKSVVRAMDATQDFMLDEQDVQIDKFFIVGASKRGWTTWLTAAFEAGPNGANRISAIAPGVIDFLNIDESMVHHRNVYAAGPTPPVECVTLGNPSGCSLVEGFSLAVGDYVSEGVMQQLAPQPGETLSPRAQELLDIIDPYEYRDRLTVPKYIVNSTGDQFFAPDSSQFYYDDLSGEKFLRYIPNTDHGLNDSALEGALAFKTALDLGLSLPNITWEVSPDGTSITVNTDVAAETVLMWEAINPQNRDFRQATFGGLFGRQWDSSSLEEQDSGNYTATVSIPATGATAFMIELEYDLGSVGGLPPIPIKFTTEISVVGVPEPASCVLLLTGLAMGLISVGRLGSRRSRPSRDRYRRGHVPRATECD